MITIIVCIVIIMAMSFSFESRLATVEMERREILDVIKIKDDEIASKISNIQEINEYVKSLSEKSTELVRDYYLVVELLKEEIGLEEANKRYEVKKSEKDTPKDLNELLSLIDKDKKER